MGERPRHLRVLEGSGGTEREQEIFSAMQRNLPEELVPDVRNPAIRFFDAPKRLPIPALDSWMRKITRGSFPSPETEVALNHEEPYCPLVLYHRHGPDIISQLLVQSTFQRKNGGCSVADFSVSGNLLLPFSVVFSQKPSLPRLTQEGLFPLHQWSEKLMVLQGVRTSFADSAVGQEIRFFLEIPGISPRSSLLIEKSHGGWHRWLDYAVRFFEGLPDKTLRKEPDTSDLDEPEMSDAGVVGKYKLKIRTGGDQRRPLALLPEILALGESVMNAAVADLVGANLLTPRGEVLHLPFYDRTARERFGYFDPRIRPYHDARELSHLLERNWPPKNRE